MSDIKNSYGGVAVELAVALPVALGFLMFMYWFFIMVTWSNALRDAVVTAVDLAKTRGDAVNMGFRSSAEDSSNGGLLVYLEDLKAGSWTAQYLGEIGADGGLLVSGAVSAGSVEGTGTTAQQVYDGYLQKSSMGWGNSATLQDFHVQNYYAMAYAYEIIRARIGNSVQFPCDPNPDGNPADGAGCVICTPPAQSSLGVANGSLFGVQCTMQPSDVLLGPITRILGGAGISPVILSYSALENIN